MYKIFLIITLFILNTFTFGQAREDAGDEYKTYLTLVILQGDREDLVIREGREVSVRMQKGYVSGRWFFKSFPDTIVIKTKKGKTLNEFSINSQRVLRIPLPQSSGPRLGLGIGVGPVGISSRSGGGGYNNYNLKEYDIIVREQRETKAEKIKREYEEQKEEERLLKEAKRKARRNKKKKK